MSARYKAKRRARYYAGLIGEVRWPRGGYAPERMRCWCGQEGTCDELFDDSGLDDTCGGLGILNCRCGGDLCVCHYHGETDCHGCEDCEEPADDDDLEDDFHETCDQ